MGLGLDDAGAGDQEKLARAHMDRADFKGVAHLVAVGVLLAVVVSRWWLLLPGFVGCGLAFAGFSGFCLMGEAMARMPWNRPRRGGCCATPVDCQHIGLK
jgi:hypothetical protein